MEIQECVPVYLIHTSGRKFWDLTLNNRLVTIRIGKLREGRETSVKTSSDEHLTRGAAILQAQQHIQQKLEKGYSEQITISSQRTTQVSNSPSIASPTQNRFCELLSSARDSFTGAYLELKDAGQVTMFQVTINGAEVIEAVGPRGYPKTVTRKYPGNLDAVNAARRAIRAYLWRGYVRDMSKFKPSGPTGSYRLPQFRPETIELDIEEPPGLVKRSKP